MSPATEGENFKKEVVCNLCNLQVLAAKLDTGLGAGHQVPNLTRPPASPSPQNPCTHLSA